MKRLLWAIRMFLADLFVRGYIQPALDLHKVPWTKDDKATLLAFLCTPVGERLQSHMLAYAQNTDQWAVATGTPHACGVAAGQRMMLSMMVQISGYVPPQADDTEAEQLQGLPRQRNPFPEPGNDNPDKS